LYRFCDVRIVKDLRANPVHAQWRDPFCIVGENEKERHFNLVPTLYIY